MAHPKQIVESKRYDKTSKHATKNIFPRCALILVLEIRSSYIQHYNVPDIAK